MRNFELIYEAHHGHVTLWLKWRAIIEHNAGTDREGGYEPVPHHPSGGSVVEHTTLWAQVAVQDVLLLVLEERTECRMNDALRWPSGTRGVENVKWV